jgi:hypothetical protein
MSRSRREKSKMKILRLLSHVAVLPLLLLPAAALAGEDQSDRMCPAPIAVCQNTAGSPDGCPAGYDCRCVPSCPNCRDCPVRVCVASSEPQCRTACDCEPGLGCFGHKCIAGFAPVFCCDSDECPAGEQCQHRDGDFDRCARPDPECRSACDCRSGQACHQGSCVFTDVPVYCCEGDDCRAGFPCDHRDGTRDQCKPACADQAWECAAVGDNAACGDNRICSCTAACPFCENCGPPVCVPPNLGITPYDCNDDGSCDREGDRCICVSSCAACDDCARKVCVPSCRAQDDHCEKRLTKVNKAIHLISDLSRRCSRDEDCRAVATSTECEGTCGVAVNRLRAPFVSRAVQYLDRKICSDYQDDGCSYAAVRCATQDVACIEGKCTKVTPAAPEPAGND